MAIKLVKHPQLLLVRQSRTILFHPGHAGLGIDFLRIVRDIGIGQKTPQREGKAAVVHRCIFRILLKPLPRIAKVFAEHVGVRTFGFSRLGNTGNMLEIILRAAGFTQHMHHIQPPAVHVPRCFQPMTNNAVFSSIDLLHQRFGTIVELRQAGIPQPVQRLSVIRETVAVAPR